MMQHLSKENDGAPLHTLGVCQASVPLICAIALLEAKNSPHAPESMILMGGPIDTRVNSTAVNKLAEQRGIDWFKRHCIHTVPFPNAAMGREVYPGFLQLSGFMAMNFERHVSAHVDMFNHLIEGDGDSAEKHRDFYDEYLAVMDMTAEFYLQTVERVFIRHEVPLGLLRHRDTLIDLKAIRRTALLTVEGEKDDISGVGQTEAALSLCANIPETRKRHYLQLDVGHYGVFNGSRFRQHIAPRICAFTRDMESTPA
jgi:poly(3-hydroxybutyrate) depolymerase